MSVQLYPYQRTAAEFLKTHNRVGLFLDMGLGKRCPTIVSSQLPSEKRKYGIFASETTYTTAKVNPQRYLPCTHTKTNELLESH